MEVGFATHGTIHVAVEMVSERKLVGATARWRVDSNFTESCETERHYAEVRPRPFAGAFCHHGGEENSKRAARTTPKDNKGKPFQSEQQETSLC